MDFLDYWDTRIAANESIFNTNPGLANFAFSECQALFEKITQDELDSIETALVRAARLERALVIIAAGWEPRSGAPKMCGASEVHPCLINRKRMMEIARDALEGK